MKTLDCIEWVEFRLKIGVTQAQLHQVSDRFQSNFLDLQPGYQKRTLVKLDAGGHYADLVYWASAKEMNNAIASSEKYPVCGEYFALFEIVKAPSLGTPIAPYPEMKAQRNSGDHSSPQTVLHGMEFSIFKPKPGVTDRELYEAAEQMVNGLYRDQPGFISHAVVKSEQGIYADVVLASSAKRAAALCASWGTGPFAQPCQAYLDLISPESIQVGFFDRLIDSAAPI
jgi:heme-degrading monooxygenase HmoA